MKNRKRILSIEQRIINNLISLGRTPREAWQVYKLNRLNSEMNFININS